MQRQHLILEASLSSACRCRSSNTFPANQPAYLPPSTMYIVHLGSAPGTRTSDGHPSTTNTSSENPSEVEKTCASRMLRPTSASTADSCSTETNRAEGGRGDEAERGLEWPWQGASELNVTSVGLNFHCESTHASCENTQSNT